MIRKKSLTIHTPSTGHHQFAPPFLLLLFQISIFDIKILAAQNKYVEGATEFIHHSQ